MAFISLAWTKDAFLAGRKSCTRRQWKDNHAAHFKPRSIHTAIDKDMRAGGKPIGRIQVVSCVQEDVSSMPDSDFECEGFKFMEENRLQIWGKDPRKAFEDWRNQGGIYWTVRFQPLEIFGRQNSTK